MIRVHVSTKVEILLKSWGNMLNSWPGRRVAWNGTHGLEVFWECFYVCDLWDWKVGKVSRNNSSDSDDCVGVVRNILWSRSGRLECKRYSWHFFREVSVFISSVIPLSSIPIIKKLRVWGVRHPKSNVAHVTLYPEYGGTRIQTMDSPLQQKCSWQFLPIITFTLSAKVLKYWLDKSYRRLIFYRHGQSPRGYQRGRLSLRRRQRLTFKHRITTIKQTHPTVSIPFFLPSSYPGFPSKQVCQGSTVQCHCPRGQIYRCSASWTRSHTPGEVIASLTVQDVSSISYDRAGFQNIWVVARLWINEHKCTLNKERRQLYRPKQSCPWPHKKCHPSPTTKRSLDRCEMMQRSSTYLRKMSQTPGEVNASLTVRKKLSFSFARVSYRQRWSTTRVRFKRIAMEQTRKQTTT